MPSSSPQAEPCLWAGGERHSTSAEHMWVKSGCTHLPLVPFSICNELDAFLQAAINVCSGVMQFISYQCIWRITFHCRCIKPAGHLSKKKINMCLARSWKWTKSDFLLMQKNLYVFVFIGLFRQKAVIISSEKWQSHEVDLFWSDRVSACFQAAEWNKGVESIWMRSLIYFLMCQCFTLQAISCHFSRGTLQQDSIDWDSEGL